MADRAGAGEVVLIGERTLGEMSRIWDTETGVQIGVGTMRRRRGEVTLGAGDAVGNHLGERGWVFLPVAEARRLAQALLVAARDAEDYEETTDAA